MHASNTAAGAHDLVDDSCQKSAEMQLCCCVSQSAKERCSPLTTTSPSVIAATTTAYTRASKREEGTLRSLPVALGPEWLHVRQRVEIRAQHHAAQKYAFGSQQRPPPSLRTQPSVRTCSRSTCYTYASYRGGRQGPLFSLPCHRHFFSEYLRADEEYRGRST